MFTNKEIFNGLLNNDKDVSKFLLDSISPEIKEKVSWWFKGEYLLERITKKFIIKRLIKLKYETLSDVKNLNEISAYKISDFCQKDFYDHLFNLEIAFKHLENIGQHYVRKRINKRNVMNIPDMESDIEDLCMVSLKAFYNDYIRLFPNDQYKCNLGVYYGILKNKTIDYFKANEIKIRDLDYENVDSNDERKYRIRESIDDDLSKKELKSFEGYDMNINQEETVSFLTEIFGEVLEDDSLEEITKIAEEYILCFKQHKISLNCVKIVLLIYYGLEHAEIREIVRNDNGEIYEEDVYRNTLARCRRKIKKKCSELMSHKYIS